MQKALVLFISILALLISSTVPKAHAMMIMQEMPEMTTSHCADMKMASDNTQTEQTTNLNCCDDCQCLMAPCPYLQTPLLANKTSQANLRMLPVSLDQLLYSDPAQDFFIPPKIN